mgnify:CR=1 FL=1
MPSSSAARNTSSSVSAELDLLAGRRANLDVQAEGLHLLDEDLEGLGDPRLGDVLALHDGLVDLDATEHVVGLDREQLLQGVGGTVGLSAQTSISPEPLAAELGLPAQGLLRDHRVGTGRTRVDLVVDQVEQLQDVGRPTVTGSRTARRSARRTAATCRRRRSAGRRRRCACELRMAVEDLVLARRRRTPAWPRATGPGGRSPSFLNPTMAA